MALVQRLKAAYDICCGNEALSQFERDQIHFYLAIRSIVFKLTKGNAPNIDEDYLAKVEKIKLPNTKIRLLQQLLAKAIELSSEVIPSKITNAAFMDIPSLITALAALGLVGLGGDNV